MEGTQSELENREARLDEAAACYFELLKSGEPSLFTLSHAYSAITESAGISSLASLNFIESNLKFNSFKSIKLTSPDLFIRSTKAG